VRIATRARHGTPLADAACMTSRTASIVASRSAQLLLVVAREHFASWFVAVPVLAFAAGAAAQSPEAVEERASSAAALAAPDARAGHDDAVLTDHGRTLRFTSSQRSVALGCAATSILALRDGAFVLCPPREMLWVPRVDAAPVERLAPFYDLSALRMIRGAPHVELSTGEVAPLERWPRAPRETATSVPFERPDPRVEAILSRARELAEAGRSVAVLDHLEAVRPVCPPMVWDADIAEAAMEGVRSLPVPDDRRANLFIGIPFLGVGLGGGLIATLVILIDTLADATISALSGSGMVTPIDGLGIAWGVGGGLAAVGVGIMLSAISPTADAFRGRQSNLLARYRPPRRRLGREHPIIAFGHPDCSFGRPLATSERTR
jgi:hypothetical protein